MLQRAIEESKNGDPNHNPNTDNMSYEQLLELEERMGKVGKGLSKAAIAKIPVTFWQPYKNSKTCSICMEDFEFGN